MDVRIMKGQINNGSWTTGPDLYTFSTDGDGHENMGTASICQKAQIIIRNTLFDVDFRSESWWK
jgi:hypothetical protein